MVIEKFSGNERRGQIVYTLDAQPGLTLGKLAKLIKLSKTMTLAYCKSMVADGFLYKCEVPNGDRGKWTKYVYLTPSRMAQLLGSQPEKGATYKVRQMISFEIIEQR